LDRGRPLLVCQVDRDIVAHFVECFFAVAAGDRSFENVKAEAGSDRRLISPGQSLVPRHEIRRHPSCRKIIQVAAA